MEFSIHNYVFISLQRALRFYIWSGSSSTESAMLHRNVSTVAQNGQTIALALERAFCMATDSHHRLSCLLGNIGVTEGNSVGCNLQPHL